jgi:signal transduction histidine kinase
LSNAIKYSDENTTITCRVLQEDGNITIEITDQGMGIPEDDKNISVPGSSASNAMHVKGTGLGLNIVNSYLNLLKGHLSFTSKAGMGTTFRITIPTYYEK